MTAMSIQPYSMPHEQELPRNRVDWVPQSANAALLIHDMQKYFLSFYDSESPLLAALVHNVTSILEDARSRSIPVFYTAQPGSMSQTDRGLLKDFWGAGMAASGMHRDVVDAVAPQAGDTVLTKWRYSAFFRTGLLDMLRESGRDQLIICGVYAHVGCLSTALEAYANDIQPFFVADAVADFSAADHSMAVEYAARICAKTVSTRSLLAALDAPAGLRSPGLERGNR